MSEIYLIFGIGTFVGSVISLLSLKVYLMNKQITNIQEALTKMLTLLTTAGSNFSQDDLIKMLAKSEKKDKDTSKPAKNQPKQTIEKNSYIG